jgi:hypothetical protein
VAVALVVILVALGPAVAVGALALGLILAVGRAARS